MEQTSADNPVLLTDVVTTHLLQGRTLTTIWWKHTGKMQWYPTLGTTAILGEFTLYNLRGGNNSECSVLTEICITLKVVGYTCFQEPMAAVPPRGTGYLVSYNAGSKLVLFNYTMRAHLSFEVCYDDKFTLNSTSRLVRNKRWEFMPLEPWEWDSFIKTE
jgi:hypothetical protein